jgi:hypothetical protein
LPTVFFLVPSAICALSWLGAGLAVPRRLLSGEALLDWLTRVAVGSVACSLAVLALGRVGLLDRLLLVLLTFLGAAFGARALPALARAVRHLPKRDRLTPVLLVPIAVALVLDLVASTAPISSADALKYHLALPKLWLQTGSIADPFWRWEGFNPSGIEMLYMQGLALAGGSAAAPLHAFFAVLCSLAIFGLCRELAETALAGVVAAFLFVLQGIVTWEATSSFIELGVSFYVVLAVWHGMRWARAESLEAALWLGVFGGAAAGTKYLGLVTAVIVLGWFGVVAAVRRRGFDVAVAGAAALIAGGGWYVKNLVATGNPLYPFAFGGTWITPYVRHVIHADLSAYGVGGGVARLAILPADLIVHGQAFDRGRYVGTGIFVLALLALITRRTKATLVLLGGAIVYAGVWEEQSPQARFLLPGLAVLSAVAGAGAAPWLVAVGRRRLAVLLVLGVAGSAWLASSVALTRQLLPVTVGVQSRTAALQKLTGTYDAFLAARARAGSGTVGLAGYPFAFNFPGRAVSIDIPEFAPDLRRSEFVARLRSLGIRSILAGGGPAATPELDPVRGCLRQTAVYHARFVTSRSLGQSTPFDLVLYSLVGCGA